MLPTSPSPSASGKHRTDDVLGTYGNRGGFKKGDDITRRVAGPDPLRKLGRSLSNAILRVVLDPERWASRDQRDQVRGNGQRVRDLLGGLTFKPGRASASELNRIARNLTHIARNSEGDLSRLPGGEASLASSLAALKNLDIQALREGLLGDPTRIHKLNDPETTHGLGNAATSPRRAVLDKMLPADRDKAERVLDQITRTIDREIARRICEKPLQGIFSPPFVSSPIKDLDVADHLKRLSSDLAKIGGLEKLDVYLNTLSDADLMSWGLDAEMRQTADEMLKSGMEGRATYSTHCPEYRALARLFDAYDREIRARKMDFSDLSLKLKVALDHDKDDHYDIAQTLSDLNQRVRAVARMHGPDARSTSMNEALQLVPPAAAKLELSDPADQARTARALKQLDDDSLRLLRHCDGLKQFGLTLSFDDYKQVTLSRTEALNIQMDDAIQALIPCLTSHSVDASALVQSLRNLSELGLRREQQLTEMGWSKEECDELTGSTAKRALSNQNAKINWKLLNSLEEEFGWINRDLAARHGETEAGRRLLLTENQLRNIRAVLGETQSGRTDYLRKWKMPKDFHKSMAEMYGTLLRHSGDKQHGRPVFLLPPPQVTSTYISLVEDNLSSTIEAPPRAEILKRHSHYASDEEFVVTRIFESDALHEGSVVSLSIRGAGMDGKPVRFDWSDPHNASKNQNQRMLDALSMLKRVELAPE